MDNDRGNDRSFIAGHDICLGTVLLVDAAVVYDYSGLKKAESLPDFSARFSDHCLRSTQNMATRRAGVEKRGRRCFTLERFAPVSGEARHLGGDFHRALMEPLSGCRRSPPSVYDRRTSFFCPLFTSFVPDVTEERLRFGVDRCYGGPPPSVSTTANFGHLRTSLTSRPMNSMSLQR